MHGFVIGVELMYRFMLLISEVEILCRFSGVLLSCYLFITSFVVPVVWSNNASEFKLSISLSRGNLTLLIFIRYDLLSCAVRLYASTCGLGFSLNFCLDLLSMVCASISMTHWFKFKDKDFFFYSLWFIAKFFASSLYGPGCWYIKLC